MQNAFQNLNWLAIVTAAVSAFVLGGLWYSPLMFAKRWMKETGITEESTKNANMIKIFLAGFHTFPDCSFFLAMFIGTKAGAAIWSSRRIYGRTWLGIHLHGYKLPVRIKNACTFPDQFSLQHSQPDHYGIYYRGHSIAFASPHLWSLALRAHCHRSFSEMGHLPVRRDYCMTIDHLTLNDPTGTDTQIPVFLCCHTHLSSQP